MLKLTKVGIFDYSFMSDLDCLDTFPYRLVMKQKEKEGNPGPFLSQCDYVTRVACTSSTRKWIPYHGNIHGAIGIPLNYFPDNLRIEFFPTISSFAIRDTCNKYAPNQYLTKFPNDVVCKEHGCKTSGIMIRREGNYAICVFGLNLVEAPPDELLRKEGLHACCLKKHTDKIPAPEEFMEAAGMRMLELIKKIDTPDKYADYFNDSFGIYEKKTFFVKINNRNADVVKDGFLWTRKFPNALFKGSLNGEVYEVEETFYDRDYYRVAEGEGDDKKADIINERNKKEREEEEANKNKP